MRHPPVAAAGQPADQRDVLISPDTQNRFSWLHVLLSNVRFGHDPIQEARACIRVWIDVMERAFADDVGQKRNPVYQIVGRFDPESRTRSERMIGLVSVDEPIGGRS